MSCFCLLLSKDSTWFLFICFSYTSARKKYTWRQISIRFRKEIVFFKTLILFFFRSNHSSIMCKGWLVFGGRAVVLSPFSSHGPRAPVKSEPLCCEQAPAVFFSHCLSVIVVCLGKGALPFALPMETFALLGLGEQNACSGCCGNYVVRLKID